MDNALHPSFLLDLDRDHETLAADGNELILHGAAFSETTQISAQRLLNRAALFFHVATDAGEFQGSFIFERAIGLDLVAEVTQEVGEIFDLGREETNLAPLRAHGSGWILRDEAPFRRAIDHPNHVADFSGLERGACDA